MKRLSPTGWLGLEHVGAVLDPRDEALTLGIDIISPSGRDTGSFPIGKELDVAGVEA